MEKLEFRSISAPVFWASSFPDDDPTAVRALSGTLAEISLKHRDFAYAVMLHEYCENRLVADLRIQEVVPEGNDILHYHAFREWQETSKRDGVMSIAIIREAMNIIRSRTLMIAPNLAKVVDMKALKRAHELMSERFPGIDQLRNTVAHPRDNHSKYPSGDRSKVSGDFQVGAFIGWGLNSATLSISDEDCIAASQDGKIRSLALSRESLKHLTECVTAFFSGFGVVGGMDR